MCVCLFFIFVSFYKSHQPPHSLAEILTISCCCSHIDFSGECLEIFQSSVWMQFKLRCSYRKTGNSDSRCRINFQLRTRTWRTSVRFSEESWETDRCVRDRERQTGVWDRERQTGEWECVYLLVLHTVLQPPNCLSVHHVCSSSCRTARIYCT